MEEQAVHKSEMAEVEADYEELKEFINNRAEDLQAFQKTIENIDNTESLIAYMELRIARSTDRVRLYKRICERQQKAKGDVEKPAELKLTRPLTACEVLMNMGYPRER